MEVWNILKKKPCLFAETPSFTLNSLLELVVQDSNILWPLRVGQGSMQSDSCAKFTRDFIAYICDSGEGKFFCLQPNMVMKKR